VKLIETHCSGSSIIAPWNRRQVPGLFAHVTYQSTRHEDKGSGGYRESDSPAPPTGRRGVRPDRRRPLRLVHLTDTHLFADPAGRLLGLTTRHSFEGVLARAVEAASAADAAIFTGDLVHDETADGYAFLSGRLQELGLPCYCLPGNHDRRDLMESALGAAAVGHMAIRRLGGWNLILLDSTRLGHEGGHLDPRQLERLDAWLSEDPAPSLVFLHQHPIPARSLWIDTMGVDNGEALIAVCDRWPNLKAVVFGHIHQELQVARNGYLLLGTPSTCIQFLPGSDDFALDTRTPGYRELLLYPDGRLETAVVRLPAYPEPLDFAALGY